jgi:hypothetical protein
VKQNSVVVLRKRTKENQKVQITDKYYQGSCRKSKKSKERKRMGIKEDIYDIILSHLLDEGYADTQEAAEAIMVNMSEDWRESIVG